MRKVRGKKTKHNKERALYRMMILVNHDLKNILNSTLCTTIKNKINELVYKTLTFRYQKSEF